MLVGSQSVSASSRSALSGANENGVTSSTITFGQTAPQSGPAALYGESTYGVQAYFAYVNAHGGVHGRKLKLISYDDQYSPAVSVEVTRKLIDQDQVFAEVAVNGSATNKANLTVQEPANVPVVGPQSGATFLQPFVKSVYNVWPAYTIEGKLLATFAMHNLHLKKVGVVYQNDDFGKSLLDGVHQSGMQAAKEIAYDPAQTDFSPQAQQLKAAGVDGVIILAIPSPTTKLLNAMAAISFKPARLMSQVSAIPESFSSAKEEFPGSYIGAFVPPLNEKTNAQVKLFRSAMSKYEAGKPASIFAAWGWMEAQVAVAGLQKLKGSITRDSYEKALDSLKNLQTLGGKISYGPHKHTGLKHMFIVRATSSSLVRVTR